jgi:hypothetical protein
MKLKELVSDAVLKFKGNKIIAIQKELRLLMDEAHKANDTEKVIQLLKRHATLSSALGLISKELGNRILL